MVDIVIPPINSIGKTVLIYGLTDPRNQQLRYVGKTKNKIEVRYKGHIDRLRGNSRRTNWIKKLLKEGLRPEIFIIDAISIEDDWVEAERFWIAYFKFIGCKLTNDTGGVDDLHQPSEDLKQRISATLTGRKLATPRSVEYCQNITARQLGTKRTPQQCANISLGKKGKPLSERQLAQLDRLHLITRGKPNLKRRGLKQPHSKVTRERFKEIAITRVRDKFGRFSKPN